MGETHAVPFAPFGREGGGMGLVVDASVTGRTVDVASHEPALAIGPAGMNATRGYFPVGLKGDPTET